MKKLFITILLLPLTVTYSATFKLTWSTDPQDFAFVNIDCRTVPAMDWISVATAIPITGLEYTFTLFANPGDTVQCSTVKTYPGSPDSPRSEVAEVSIPFTLTPMTGLALVVL